MNDIIKLCLRRQYLTELINSYQEYGKVLKDSPNVSKESYNKYVLDNRDNVQNLEKELTDISLKIERNGNNG